MDHPTRDAFSNSQSLAAAAILRTDPQSCGIVARALSYIGERSKPKNEDKALRDFFRN